MIIGRNEDDVLSKNVLWWECNTNLERLTFNEQYTPINQMWTLQLNIGQYAAGLSAQPFKTIKDYNDWLSRLDDYLIWLNSAEDRMREGMLNGYVLPKSLTKKVIHQLKTITNTNLDENLFKSPIRQFPLTFSEEEKLILSNKYKDMILNKIIPAYQKLYDFMKNEYLSKGRDSSGIDVFEDGSDYYNYSIKLYTTTEMTADEIHKLGLSEVAKISSEMEKVYDKQKKIKIELENFLSNIPNIPHPDVPNGKDENDNIEVSKSGKLPNFDFTPKSHYALGENLDMLDFDLATKTTGSRFVFVKNKLALLERALSLIHISEPTRLRRISYAVFCL